MKKLLGLVPLLLWTALHVGAQDRPFAGELERFRKADSLDMPPKGAVVFVGSSSFRGWRDVQQDFPDHTIINRGFGGSSLPHVIAYADEIIIPYKPKQVVIYCGENDFMNDTVTSQIVVDRFKTLFALLREALPRAEILFVSIKPSPSRRHLMEDMAEANREIRTFLDKQRRATFINIWDAMLRDGEPRPELFVKDMLHMNRQGYAIWQEAIQPHLK